MTAPEVGIITEQNDMGLGFNPLAEAEVASLAEGEKVAKKKSKKKDEEVVTE